MKLLLLLTGAKLYSVKHQILCPSHLTMFGQDFGIPRVISPVVSQILMGHKFQYIKNTNLNK